MKWGKFFTGFLILVLCLVALVEARFLGRLALGCSIHFARSGYNYEQLVQRFAGRTFETVNAAREFLPPSAIVELSNGKQNINKVALRYKFYPIKVGAHGGYFLDWDKTLTATPPGWKVEKLPTGVNLYAKTGTDFVRPHEEAKTNQGWAFLVFMGMLVCQLCVGRFFLDFLLGRGGRGIWFWANSYLAGYFVLTGVLWIFMLTGGRLGRAEILTLWVGLGIFVYLFRFLRKGKIIHDMDAIVGIQKQEFNLWSSLIQIVFLFIVVQVLAVVSQVPVNDWDGMSHWVLKAKIFFYEQRLNFQDTHNNAYPLLWPLGVAVPFVLAGIDFDIFAQWQSGFFFLVFMIQFIAGLTILRVKRWLIYFMGTFYVLITFREPGSIDRLLYYINANAENIFMAYITAALVALLVWWRAGEDTARRGFLKLSIGFLVALSLIKLEGMVAAVCLLLTCAWLFRKKLSWQDRVWVAGGCILSTILPLAWAKWNFSHGFVSVVSHLQHGVSVGNILPQLILFCQSSGVNLMVIIFLLWGALIGVYGRDRGWSAEEKFLGIVFLLLFGFSALSTIGWPAEDARGIFREVFPRLFFHATPALVFLWASRVHRED